MEDKKHGSSTFYKLLEQMSAIHDKKSHDYASDSNPYGNYHFAGQLGQLFKNPNDAGFIARIGEKLYRLANLENEGRVVLNESIEDTEIDIVTIVALWIASRRDGRRNKLIDLLKVKMNPLETPWIDETIKTIPSPEYDDHFPEICTYCNVGDVVTRIRHAILVHVAVIHDNFLIYPNQIKKHILSSHINQVNNDF